MLSPISLNGNMHNDKSNENLEVSEICVAIPVFANLHIYLQTPRRNVDHRHPSLIQEIAASNNPDRYQYLNARYD
jgi:hypothetical protein